MFQNSESVGECEKLALKGMEESKPYREGEIPGFKAFRFDNDYALLSEVGDLLVGDNAVSDIHGKLIPAPDRFPGVPVEKLRSSPYVEFRSRILSRLKEIVKSTGATNFLGSHGYDIIGDLGKKVENI